MFKEKVVSARSGVPALLLALAFLVIPIAGIVLSVRGSHGMEKPVGAILAWVVIWVVDLICLAGFFSVQPNQRVVLTLFGNYVGTVSDAGLKFANPFYSKKPISCRVRNFETSS